MDTTLSAAAAAPQTSYSQGPKIREGFGGWFLYASDYEKAAGNQ